MLRYIKTLLEVDDYKVETATTGEEALQHVEKGLQPDLVLLDVLMPGIDGLQTLEQLRQMQPGVKVVMLSCVNDTRKVVHAMKLGAQDYLTKPFQKAELDAVIDLSLGQGKQTFSGEVEELADDVFFIAASPQMRKIRSQAALVANVDIPVLLLGESGTGKEVLGAPDSQAFAARAPHVSESELRGGSRRPAGKRIVRLRARRVHRRDARQARQIRTLQQGHDPARRNRRDAAAVAGQAAARFAGSAVLAPGQPLRDQSRRAHSGRDQHQHSRSAGQQAPARGSLLPPERLHHADLPPLRERKEEIPILLKHSMTRMAERYARAPLPLSPALLQACQNHSWPGNLRELNNFLKRYLILGDESLAVSELLPRNDGNGGMHGDSSARAASRAA